MSPHDAPQQWVEPTDKLTRSGKGTFDAPKSPYDFWMEAQNIPIYRDIGVHKVQNLPLKPWEMMGGNATFIQLFGTEGMWGLSLIHI